MSRSGRVTKASLRYAQFARVAAVIAGAVCLIAALLVWRISAETVLFTGPVITLLGLLMAWTAWRGGYAALIGLGWANVGICLLFLLLVNLLNWSPRAARMPFVLMGAMYVAAYAAACYWAWNRLPKLDDRSTCARCDYPLFGLSGDRCPECGLAFDPRDVPGSPPVQG